MEMDVSIKYEMKEDPVTGYKTMVPDRDEHQFVAYLKDLIVEHIIECKEFRVIYACADSRTFQYVVQCNCDMTWKIDDFLIKRQGSELQMFLRGIEGNELRIDNEPLMEVIYRRRNDVLKKKIVKKIEEVKLAKKNIESSQQLEHCKKMRNPIFCLEVE